MKIILLEVEYQLRIYLLVILISVSHYKINVFAIDLQRYSILQFQQYTLHILFLYQAISFQNQNGDQYTNINNLLGESYRKQFLNELIVHLNEEYMEQFRKRKDQDHNDDLKITLRSYIQFLIIEQLYPPKILSLLYSEIQEMRKKNKMYQLFLFNQLLNRAQSTFNSLQRSKTLISQKNLNIQKPLPILLPIQFDEMLTLFKNKLSNQLLRQKDFIDYLCSGYLHLTELEEKAIRNITFIKELLKLQKNLIRKNPSSEEFQNYSNIFNLQLNFFNIDSIDLQRRQLEKKKFAILKNVENIDVFSSDCCSIYISLTNKNNQILKVSSNFSKIFNMQSSLIIGKSLNTLMVKQMNRIHDEYVNQFTQNSTVSTLHTKQRQIYGLCGQGFIIPLTISIKIENSMNTIGLCALITRDFKINSYNLLTDETGKIITLSKSLYMRVFKKAYKLNELQEQNIEKILEIIIGNGLDEEQTFNQHGLIKVKIQNINSQQRKQNKFQNSELILYTKFKQTVISTDLYNTNQHLRNYEFQNFWEKTESDSQVQLNQSNFPFDISLSLRKSKSEQVALSQKTSVSPRQVNTLNENSQEKIQTQQGQLIQQKISFPKKNERRCSLIVNSQNYRLNIVQQLYSKEMKDSCVFEVDDDEEYEKLTPRKLSVENLNKIFLEKEDSSRDQQMKLNSNKETNISAINSFNFGDTFCLSPNLSKQDLSTRPNEYDLIFNGVNRNKENSTLFQSVLNMKKLESINLEQISSPINQNRTSSFHIQSLEFANIFQEDNHDNNQYNKQLQTNSSMQNNKFEENHESLSSKKQEKVEQKKRQVIKQIQTLNLNKLPKLICMISILSVMILISSSFYFYINDNLTIEGSQKIFHKINKASLLAINLFIYSKEKMYTKLLKTDQKLLQIDNNTLNYLVSDSLKQQIQLVKEFNESVQSLMFSKGEEYFDYMVSSKIKVLSSLKEPNERDTYRNDTVLYNLLNFVSSLNQIVIDYETPDRNHFPSSVVYGNLLVFEESLSNIQHYVIEQTNNFFEQIQSDQILQIFMISTASLVIFILAFPFSLYLQKKKATLLQLLGSYQPKKLEEYIFSLQQSLDKIRQFEQEQYLAQNSNILNNMQHIQNIEQSSENIVRNSLVSIKQNIFDRLQSKSNERFQQYNIEKIQQNMMEQQFKQQSIIERLQQNKDKKRRTRQLASFNNYQITTGYHIIVGFIILGLLIIQPLINKKLIDQYTNEGKDVLFQQQIINQGIQFAYKQQMLHIKTQEMIPRYEKKDVFYLTYGLTILNQFDIVNQKLQTLINQDSQSRHNQQQYEKQYRSYTHGNICDVIKEQQISLQTNFTSSECENFSSGVFKRGFLLALITQIQSYKEQWDIYSGSEQEIRKYFIQQQQSDSNIIQQNKASQFLLQIFAHIEQYMFNSKQELSSWLQSILTYLLIFQALLIMLIVTLGSFYLYKQFNYGLKSTQQLLTNIPIQITIENDYILRYFKNK